MEQFIPLISEVGFPIVVTLYLLYRIESKLDLVVQSIQNLPEWLIIILIKESPPQGWYNVPVWISVDTRCLILILKLQISIKRLIEFKFTLRFYCIIFMLTKFYSFCTFY
jgi:hypothetical protein